MIHIAKSIVTKMEKDGIALDQAQAPAKAQKKVPVKGHDHPNMR